MGLGSFLKKSAGLSHKVAGKVAGKTAPPSPLGSAVAKAAGTKPMAPALLGRQNGGNAQPQRMGGQQPAVRSAPRRGMPAMAEGGAVKNKAKSKKK